MGSDDVSTWAEKKIRFVFLLHDYMSYMRTTTQMWSKICTNITLCVSKASHSLAVGVWPVRPVCQIGQDQQ